MPTLQPGPLTLAALCERLGAEPPAGLKPDLQLTGLTTIAASRPGDVTFLTRPRLRPEATVCKASLVLVPKGLDFDDERALVVADVGAAIISLLEHFHPVIEPPPVIHATAVVDPTAKVGERVALGAHCVVEAGAVIGDGARLGPGCVVGPGAVIGPDCRIHDRVTVASGCKLGARCILHTGVVIGADGFRYESVNGRLAKMPQVGIVEIGDDVEVGANTTIDRASFTVTRVGDRTKIDNLVQVGHNCEIGSDCVIVAQVGIGGSCKLGRGVIIGGQAGLSDNTTVGDGVRIAGQAGVHGEIPAGSEIAGSPAVDARTFFKAHGVFRQLPEIYRQVRPFLEGSKS
jgi:UDP-3-O-[3-hydroxymyristoyl] glucosamine N-acyltransferase